MTKYAGYDEYENACGYANMYRDEDLTIRQALQVCEDHGANLIDYMRDTASDMEKDGTDWLESTLDLLTDNENPEEVCCINAGSLSDWLGY